MAEVIKLTLEDFQRLKKEYDMKEKEKEANKNDKITKNKSNKIGGNRKKIYIVSSFF